MKPDITIFCLTYNHASFIEDALRGFLIQKTSYTYKIFVFDDASTDGTSEILRKYEKQYPDLLDVCISPYNIYKNPERPSILQKLYEEHIEGEYVAWCEGDDCWIDEEKLQLQLDYMKSHPECSITAHGSKWIDYKKNEEKEYRPYHEDRYLTPHEVIVQPYGNLSTASLVMRKEVFFREDKYPKCDVGDIPRQLYGLYKGKIFYFNRIMSLYRYMHTNSWSSRYDENAVMMWKHKFIMADFFVQYDIYTEYRYHSDIKIKIKECLYNRHMKDKKIPMRQVKKIAEQVNQETNFKYSKSLQNQLEIARTIREEVYLCNYIVAKIKDKKNVIVMGTGQYSKDIVSKLQKQSIKIDGFVVSDNQEISENSAVKPVWKLNECPYIGKDTALVIGISDKYQIEIEHTLEQSDITEYIAPYWMNSKEFYVAEGIKYEASIGKCGSSSL